MNTVTMIDAYAGFETHVLEGCHVFYVGRLPSEFCADAAAFQVLWDLHPCDYHLIKMHGRLVETPRWQQAYGADYHYTGRTNTALPIPPILEPLHNWARQAIDERLNGLLLNWYDGTLGHSIRPHKDSTKNMVCGAAIVTFSLGEQRVFRLTHPKQKLKRDLPAEAGTVFIMPYETNKAWKHSVPKRARYRGGRISITPRAFQS
jgi:alkylated DNA repair dioxygenase AlkB